MLDPLCLFCSALQIGSILSMIYLFLIIVEVIVNLKNKPEAVEKVGWALTRLADDVQLPQHLA